MTGILRMIGVLTVFGVGFSPFLAQQLWNDPFIIMQAWWYKPAIFAGFGLIFIPTILSNIFGVGRVKSGLPAVGVIRSVQQTGTYINEQPEVRLSLTVSRKGREKYDTELKTVVPLTALAQFQPGSFVPLVVSEKDERKVGIDLKGQLSQADLQELLNEKMIQEGVSPDMMDIARTGEKAMAKILDVTPLGNSGTGKIKLQLTLSVTPPNGETFQVTTQKDILPSALSQVQQGHIINVIYSKQDPSKLVLALNVQEEQLSHLFSS
ncbi:MULTISPECIES: hypothetical protein [Paenibacillus]|uniref:hypothetical protein n=1 Tax=Paenibacillus TaxID=44249 RepID=UPI00129D9807|nr:MULTISPECIES: hypothetical protein [Paenibacillus]MBE7683566.1 hypothetical protein [Paenibacillus sp. P13VS]MBY0217158.1 hypothetical protein [Paenibacillus illinoisensis]